MSRKKKEPDLFDVAAASRAVSEEMHSILVEIARTSEDRQAAAIAASTILSLAKAPTLH